MTLKEIASAAGVSAATVSRVMNRTGYVNGETFERVMEAASAGGYFQKRAGKKPGSLAAVVVPDLANPFFTDIIRGIRMVMEKANKVIIVLDSHKNVQMERRILARLQEFDLCGVIIAPISDSGEDAEGLKTCLNHLAVPVVLVDRDVRNTDLDGVFLDYVQAAFEATCFLIQSGFTEIAIVAGPGHAKPGREQRAGYVNALQKYQLPVREEWMVEGDDSIEGGYAWTCRLLAMRRPPRAIFSCNNLMTLGCIKALRKHNLEIGGDEGFALVGFDQAEAIDILGMKMPTVKSPTVEMGKTAAELLLRGVGNERAGLTGLRRRILLSPSLELHD